MATKDDRTYDLHFIGQVREMIWTTGSVDIARQLDSGQITYTEAAALLRARIAG